jgi:carbamoyl-phosphate synthase small subunit
MGNTAYLILENGKTFEGKFFGAQGNVTGEIVFTTGMTGYLETLTDQGCHGQIVLQTFPLIGNYGVIPDDFESASIGAKAYIVKHPCENPSNFRSEGTLDAFMKERGIVGLCGIDTRSLAKIIRENGVMNGKITSYPPMNADCEETKKYSVSYPISAISQRTVTKTGAGKRRIALLDFGVKRGITDALASHDCEVWTFPHNSTVADILKMKPHGILLSNGPGNPADPGNNEIIETIKVLLQNSVPIFGICIGHQLLAIANGYKTKKMKFGHRGSNQPVKDTKTGSVYITSQSHGYEVIADNADPGLCSFVNVNDGTCEGLDYGNSFSVQFYPGARGGPLDTAFLFSRFMERIDIYASK